MGPFLLILFIIAIAVAIVVFYKKDRQKKTVDNDVPTDNTVVSTEEEEARIKAEEEARIKAEEEARIKAEEEARIKAEEEARIKAEEEARIKAEEEARIKAEEEARIKAEEEYISKFENCLSAFAINISNGSETYKYFKQLYDEAYNQFYNKTSLNNIPILLIEDNFPHFYKFGEIDNIDASYKSLIGWLFALQLAELIPLKKTNIFKIGYELGGYNKYSNIYGYTFESDPNIARKVAAALYCAMRGKLHPNTDKMRIEVGGTKYNETLSKLSSQSRDNVGEKDFFIDFREFMPTAPGPYAPGYKTRPDKTYPNEQKDEYKNLQIDRDIHEDIITKYNLDNEIYKQATVQAIADKESESQHLFGKDRQTKNYKFHPVFGTYNIGIELQELGAVEKLVGYTIYASSCSRSILQSATVSPKQYGRLRPGCSWENEATPNSSTDNRRNILTNFEIEDGDGSPTGYYDKNGNWVYKNAINSPSDFEKAAKKSLWANSYPSGHSSGIMGGAMGLIEIMPDKADKILKAANQFAVNRTIARYHWTSDTRNGRILGSAQNAVAHAASNYDELLNNAIKEIKDYARN